MIGIYQIKCLTNKKVYIGCSTNITQRHHQHFMELCIQKHPNSSIQEDWIKYKGNFSFNILEKTSAKNMLEREEFWIRKHFGKNCYNTIIPKNIHPKNVDQPFNRSEAIVVSSFLMELGKDIPGGWHAVWRMTPTKVSKLYDVSLVGVINAARRTE